MEAAFRLARFCFNDDVCEYTYSCFLVFIIQYGLHVVLLHNSSELTEVVLTDNVRALMADKDSTRQRSLVYPIKQLHAEPLQVCPQCSTALSMDCLLSETIKESDFVMNIDINMRSFLDNYIDDGWDSLSALDIQYPLCASSSGASHMEAKNVSRTLVFPKIMSHVGKRAYIDFYCRQIKYKGQVMSRLKLYGLCVVYVSHLLREEHAQMAHLAKTPPSPTPNINSKQEDRISHSAQEPTSVFDSWRGVAEKEGSPGVSIHVNDSDLCTEPIFCHLGKNVQEHIFKWQNPPVRSDVASERTCDNSKYLVYMSTLQWASIGSWMHQTALLLQYAMCHNRILLMPTKGILHRVNAYMKMLGPSYPDYSSHTRWIHDDCLNEDSVFDCYFKPVSSCSLDEDQYISTFANFAGSEPDVVETLNSDAKYVSISFIPFIGSCSIGAMSWEGSFKFFGDMDVGLGKYAEKTKLHEWGPVHKLVKSTDNSGAEYGAFAGGDSFPMKAQLLRYLLRPKRYGMISSQQLH